VTELIKEDHAFTIGITFLKASLWVTHFDTPALEDRNRKLELLVSDSLVAIEVNLVESHPVLVILAQILEQVPVLAPFHVVFAMLTLGLNFVLRSIECSNHDRLRLEQQRDPNHVTHTLV